MVSLLDPSQPHHLALTVHFLLGTTFLQWLISYNHTQPAYFSFEQNACRYYSSTAFHVDKVQISTCKRKEKPRENRKNQNLQMDSVIQKAIEILKYNSYHRWLEKIFSMNTLLTNIKLRRLQQPRHLPFLLVSS